MLKKFAFPVGLWYNKSYCAVLAVTFYMSLSAGSGKDIITLDKAFRKGILQGIPIALGYLSVSFGFGIMAVRAGLSVSAAVDSRTIIDSAGAEKLLGNGDMLFAPQNLPKPIRVQGAFVSDKEVSDVVEFIKEQNLVIDSVIPVFSGMSSGTGDKIMIDLLFQ